MIKNAPLALRTIAGLSIPMNVTMPASLYRSIRKSKSAIQGMSRNVTQNMTRYAILLMRGSALL